MIKYKNARILTMDGGVIFEKGDLVVKQGRIEAVGSELHVPVGTETIDCTGKTIVPGLIDPHCHLAVFDDGLRSEGEDGNEITDPITPELLAEDSYFIDDRCIKEALAAGVTSVMTGPGSANVIGGHFIQINTYGDTVEVATLKSKAAMKAAFGENPKRCYGRDKRSPMTRMANAATFRTAIQEAKWYHEQKLKKPEETKFNPKWEALLPVLTGEMMVKVHCHRDDDILTVIRLCDEFGLRFTLDHCTEGYLKADIIAEYFKTHQGEEYGKGVARKGKLVAVITGPLLSDRSKPELNRSTIMNPGILSKAGLPVAIATDHPVIPIQYLAVTAAEACRAGMAETEALAAITSTAALAVGLEAEIGKLKQGYRADFVIMTGHPFDYKTQVASVYVAGKKVYERI